MHVRNITAALLMVLLYGCQQETPAPKAAAPAAEPSAVPVVQEVAPPVAAPEKTVQPSPVEKPAAMPVKKAPPPPVAEKPSPIAEKPLPVAETPAPAMKVEAPAAAVEPKPEEKPAAPVFSEAEAMNPLKKNNCLACHAVDKKVVGPAFRDVAAKYRGDAAAEARLADKIAKGGGGVWGPMAMPPSPQIGEADRRMLAAHILSLK